ncbi:hypothetical protein QBC42DRAFT_252043 [Cladorrhinum samala]|uniref:Uncharacterized protein n=1 Tax=Cladorrhinum samala TaxID=585594 RepID=A0AAV9HM50_9PEZI|nr:hypothetical protein QBC42DRAFT_252043 [Cladorrhinum samala]
MPRLRFLRRLLFLPQPLHFQEQCACTVYSHKRFKSENPNDDGVVRCPNMTHNASRFCALCQARNHHNRCRCTHEPHGCYRNRRTKLQESMCAKCKYDYRACNCWCPGRGESVCHTVYKIKDRLDACKRCRRDCKRCRCPLQRCVDCPGRLPKDVPREDRICDNCRENCAFLCDCEECDCQVELRIWGPDRGVTTCYDCKDRCVKAKQARMERHDRAVATRRGKQTPKR